MAAASANTLGVGGFNSEYWAKEMQKIFFKDNVAIALANTELRAVLADGDTCHKPYRSHLVAQSYVKGTAVTLNAVSGTDDSFVVNTIRVVPFYIDDIDKIQNKWDMADKYAADAMRILNNELDQAILAENSNATSSVYAADVGGSGATTNLVLTTSNIFNVFTAASRKLDALNQAQSPRFAVLGTRALETLRLALAGRETGFGEQVGANGKVGTRFGFDIYYSNNCPFGATWTPDSGTNPANGETVHVNGVLFTFVDTIGTTAGNVLQTTDTETTLDNLTLAINGTTAASATTYVALSDADRWKLTSSGIAATNSATVTTISGYGDIVVAGSADDWAAQTNHLLFGVKGSTDLVVQAMPSIEIQRADLMIGYNILPWIDRVVQVKFSLIDSETQKWMTRAKDIIISTLNDLARELHYLMKMQKSELCL